nr:MFS transporter [Thermomonospora umbrina]
MRRRSSAGVVLALACTAQFMVVLDVSVLNVALPSIRRALAFDEAGLPWVVNAYALVFAGLLLPGGRLADLYGLRRVFAAGLVVFTVASLMGGLAGSAGLLVGARALQGLGAAVLAPATLTVLTTTFAEGPARTKALAVWTAVSLAGGSAGNLVGGALTELVSWRAILLVNVPIGVVTVMAARVLPAGRGRRTRPDVGGAVLATAGIASLTYALTLAHDGWGRPVTVAALAAGAVALVAFAVVQARFAAVPLIPPRLLAVRAIWAGNGVVLLTAACFQIPMWYFLSLYLQNVRGYDALAAGAAFLPHTSLMLLVGLVVTPRLMRHADDRVLIASGAVIAAAGLWWQSRALGADGYVAAVLGPAVLISIGGGLLNTPLTAVVTSGAGRADAGAVSGLMNAAKQVGGALGLAILVTVVSGHDPAGGYERAFMAMSGVLIAAASLTLALPRRRDAAHIQPTGP